jgi:hypothetical protein
MSTTQRIPPGGYIVRNYAPYIGDTLAQAFTVLENGVAADVEDDTWKMRIEDAATGTAFLTLTNGSGFEFPGGGVVKWVLTAAQTANFLPKRRYRYDIQRTKSDGTVKTIQRGEMIPHKDITPA